MKQHGHVAFFCVLALLLVGWGAGAAAYSDVGGHWAEAAVRAWTDCGVLKGENGKFRPDAPMTRGELAALLSGLLGLSDEGAANPFADAPPDAWYTPSLLRCHAAGLMAGYQGKARPTDEVDRQEAAVLLARALAIPESTNLESLGRYTDAGRIAGWAAGYVAALTERGAVSGVGGSRFDPTAHVTRASVVAILDHAVSQYIHAPGRYALKNGAGLILVAAGGVTLTGESGADLLLTPAADGGSLTFDHAKLSGAVTVQADRATILLKDSKLPPPLLVGAGTELQAADVETPKPPETPRRTPSGGSHSSSSSGNSSGSGSSHGSGGQGGAGGGSGSGDPGSSQTPRDLVISEAGALDSGSYRDVRIAASVGNGTVVLKNLAISGDVYVQGGGSHSVRLIDCTVSGKVIMDKQPGTQSEAPRLALVGTAVHRVEVRQPAILEWEGTIDTIVAKAYVTMAAGAAKKVEIPADAGSKRVEIHVAAAASVGEAVVDSILGARITGDGGIGGVRAGSEEILQQIEAPSGVTVSTHDHVWDGGAITAEPTCTAPGVRTFRCALSGCTATKTEPIPALSHRWGDVQQDDSTAHKRVCAACGAEDREAHSFTAAVPVGDGHKAVCSVCGFALHGAHTAGQAVPDADGLTHSFTCAACGATWTEAHDFKDAEPDGDKHKCICSVCMFEKHEDHNWNDGEVIKAPTTTETGTRLYTCAVCTATREEAIPKVEQALTATGTVTPSRFQLTLSEAADFYDADGNIIPNGPNLAKLFSVYRERDEKQMSNLYRLESEFDGKTLTCCSRVFNYGYTEDTYALRIKDGIYARSRTSPELKLQGDIPLVYVGPQAQYSAVYNQSKHTLSFSIEASDGVGLDVPPNFDFTKMLVVQAPGGSYESAIAQTPLGGYTLSESSPRRPGTFTMFHNGLDASNPLAPVPAFWDVTVSLREEDAAHFQAIGKDECLLALDPGFCTGSAERRVYFSNVNFSGG